MIPPNPRHFSTYLHRRTLLLDKMSSSVARRVLAHSKSFLSLRSVPRKLSLQAFRRGMASDAHGAKSSNDLPWIVRGYLQVS